MRRQEADLSDETFALDDEEEKLDLGARGDSGGDNASPYTTEQAVGYLPDALDENRAMPPPAADVVGQQQAAAANKEPQARRTQDDRRRELNRLTVQRFYYRKKRAMQGLRKEEERLVQKFAALRTAISDEAHVGQQSETTQLILLKVSLQHQNALLREMTSEQSQQQLLFGRAFKATHQQVLGNMESNLVPHEYISQVSDATCAQLIQTALQEISEHKTAVQTVSQAHFSALGWDWRGGAPPSSSSASGTMSSQRFAFSKSICSDISVLQLAQRTLSMWTPADPVHSHLFPAYIQSRLRLLQQIDDHNLIVMQTMTTNRHSTMTNHEPEQSQQDADTSISPTFSSSDRRAAALLHVSLVETEPNGCTFFLRSIPREHYELDGVDLAPSTTEQLEWLDVFNWCTLTKGQHGDTEVTWGIRASPPAHFGMSAFEWLLFELTRTVRWEAAAVDTALMHTQD